ncbi:2-oxo-4-hydroxy-4-carboxy-5-ureidoimidazoline decarboxylase [Streptomyces sp. OF3]|uniref:2-oxo-4-hydroxy-4-carboxy-5-ureidoimidazoline decarboxylase n=1 Tax=Streptomyces alkaliterrae TaxID=2213162 RepID=A0A7W3WKU5_9ACTN|nr:2-oxo-4-hydroxy-4-carboxy-5-ureidoimidazoline decarboxylase [Streptomyces alkaliterrae]MBB1254206.1 2-oxo-4-hydroxy-4-carboxy-5-ureidoimidazoline decarboxylase [Streptomyces alkaliterrae]
MSAQHPLHRLNSAPFPEAEALLWRCCGSVRWARRLAAHRPYPDVEALLAAAEEACYDLSQTEVAEALAAEADRQRPGAGPRAGADDPFDTTAPYQGPGALAAHTASQAARAAYEARFQHVFVVCLDEVPPNERLAAELDALHTRLGNSEDDERAATREELRRLALSRLRRLTRAPVTAGGTTAPR